MSAIGNLLWFFLFGVLSALQWWLTGLIMFCSIIGIPWAKSCFVIGQLALLPFGKEAINRKDLTGQKDIGTGTLGLLGNIVWFFFGGLWLALAHVFAALACAVTVIGIPFAVQHLKLASLALAPIGKTIVSKDVAAAARGANATVRLAMHRGGWASPQFAQDFAAANPKKSAIGASLALLVLIVLAFAASSGFVSKEHPDKRIALAPQNRAAEHEPTQQVKTTGPTPQSANGMNQNHDVKTDANTEANVVPVRRADNDKSESAEKQILSYEVVKKVDLDGGRFSMDILVAEGSSRVDVMNLAESLTREFNGKYVTINVFDSRMARQIWEEDKNLAMANKPSKYSESEWRRRVLPNWLVEIRWTPNQGSGHEVTWCADRRPSERAQREKAKKELKAAIEAEKWRTWTDSTGLHKIEAKFGGVLVGKVKLIKKDGSPILVPIEKLSEADQEWIRNRQKRICTKACG